MHYIFTPRVKKQNSSVFTILSSDPTDRPTYLPSVFFSPCANYIYIYSGLFLSLISCSVYTYIREYKPWHLSLPSSPTKTALSFFLSPFPAGVSKLCLPACQRSAAGLLGPPHTHTRTRGSAWCERFMRSASQLARGLLPNHSLLFHPVRYFFSFYSLSLALVLHIPTIPVTKLKDLFLLYIYIYIYAVCMSGCM